jgi:[NiFe] hydrogenase assembly HybE family chaperone
MNDPRAVARDLERVFNGIHREQMQGIPILNPQLRVQALGFRLYQGRVVGILITPWLMNLLMLPGKDEDWSDLELGRKQPHVFPSGTFKFMVNEIDGIGKCQTHSLYSPMNEFINQDHALAAAQGFLDTLMVEREATEDDPVDQELLGRIMRGEEVPEVSLDDFAGIETTGTAVQAGEARQIKTGVSRRDLLRGSFLREG